MARTDALTVLRLKNQIGRIREFLKGTGMPTAIPAGKPKPRTKTFSAYVEEWLRKPSAK